MISNTGSGSFQKSLFIFSFLLSTAFCASAQSLWNQHEVHFGFKLNPTFGYLQLKNSAQLRSDGLKLGFTFGGTADYIFSRHLAATGELELSTINGGTIQTLMQSDPVTKASVPLIYKSTYQLRYLELPLAIKVRSNTIGEASLVYFKLGIDPAFKLSEGTEHISTLNGISTIQGNTNEGKLFTFCRLSYVAGVGYDYRFSHDLTFTSGLLVNQGITKISRGAGTGMTNSYLAIEFGLYF